MAESMPSRRSAAFFASFLIVFSPADVYFYTPMESSFSVPVCEAWLVYDPLRKLAALVNKQAIVDLLSGAGFSSEPELATLRNSLQTTPCIPPPKSGPVQPDFLGLITTRACNLACPYCDFGYNGQPGSVMSLDLATAAIDWMAEGIIASGRRTLEVHFFGGEPFVAPDVVETAVHRARAQAANRNLRTRFEVSSNGFFNERCRAFVDDFFDAVVLSFDGPKHVQDRHRPTRGGKGSFEGVAETAKRLANSQVELCFRACVTQSTVGQLVETTDWFLRRFRPTTICFEPLKPTEQSTEAGLEPPGPYDFVQHFWSAQERASTEGVRVIYAAADIEKPRLTFCPVGRDTIIVSPDGRISACYLRQEDWRKNGLELSFGRLSTSGGMQIDMEALKGVRKLLELPARCQRCFARWHCAGGCHVCQSPPGCKDEFNDVCIRTRLVLACQVLRELGCHDMVERLLADQGAMERLAWHKSDRLEDCEAIK